MRKFFLFLFVSLIAFSCSTTDSTNIVNDADMVLEIADLYNKSGESNAERKALEGYIKEYGYTNAKINYNLLLLYFKSGEYEKVIDRCLLLLKDSDDGDYLRLLAMSYRMIGDNKKASEVYLELVKSQNAIEDDFIKASEVALALDDSALALGILKIGIEDKFIITKKTLEAALNIDNNLSEYKILLENIL